MNSDDNTKPGPIDLRYIAAATVVVLATTALAVLMYYLIDILLLLFLGIIVAATLQPWHVRLCRWGVPKGLAVLIIYVLFLTGLVAIALLIAPVVIEEVGTFATALPATYAHFRTSLLESGTAPLAAMGRGLPTYEALTQSLTVLSPGLYDRLLGVTTNVLTLIAYTVTVLAAGFYWTLEVPRIERLVLSLLPVRHRARALTTWHEIEFKLGAFMRGQGLAMLTIGVASAVGYAVIGLPHVLALGLLAGLFEAVPLIGPVLGSAPALLAALPLGLARVLLVASLATLLQVIENNVLMPRIMSHAVGVSALVGLFAVLAFGTLYGMRGVFIAIPITAVVQVLVDRIMINRVPAETQGGELRPLAALRARVHMIRQEARLRLRGRTTRMGIDPGSVDHVVDAADHQIEEAVGRVERVISATQNQSDALEPEARATIVESLQAATTEIEAAGGRVDAMATIHNPEDAAEQTAGLPADALALSHAVQELEQVVRRVETGIATPHEGTGAVPSAAPASITDDLGATQALRDAVRDPDMRVETTDEVLKMKKPMRRPEEK
jgi:predicted PurR-regulated permease PerM